MEEEEEEGKVEDSCEVDPGMGGGEGNEVVEGFVLSFPRLALSGCFCWTDEVGLVVVKTVVEAANAASRREHIHSIWIVFLFPAPPRYCCQE